MLFISYWEVYIDSKLLLNDLENAIFQKYRHFEKIDYYSCLIPKE